MAWVSLDDLDNDLTQFWVALITALQGCVPAVGQLAFALLQSSERAPLSAILTALLNDLASIPEPAPIVLILDDYHAITGAAIHEALTFMLDHLPAHVHIVLATRVDPQLPLSRWRVRGELLELRAADLRFTAAEASTFFTHALGDALAADDVQLLSQRTEGWIAGLHLAALAMQQRADRSAFVKAFTGGHRYLADYVQEEILSRQPLPVQRFLLQTAVLRRMNAALCTALTQDTSSQTTLEWLERHNLFVAPLDDERQWYRTMVFLAHMYGSAGRLRQLEQECLEGLTRAKRLGLHTAALGNLYLNLAETYYACNRLEEAAESLHVGIQLAQTWQHSDLLLWGQTQLACLELARDDLAAMDRALQQAEELVEREQFLHWAPTVVAARVRYWLATGDDARAERWSAQTRLDQHSLTPAQDAMVFAQVRVSLARQHYMQALATLERFAAQFDQPGHIPTTVEFLTWYLVALHHVGKRAQARRVAARLFSMTEPEDNIRVYLEAGEPMRQVIESLRDTPGDEENGLPPRSLAFVAKLLAAFPERREARDDRPVDALPAETFL